MAGGVPMHCGVPDRECSKTEQIKLGIIKEFIFFKTKINFGAEAECSKNTEQEKRHQMTALIKMELSHLT